MKDYSLHGVAGLVKRRRLPSGGTVSVYCAEKAGLDAGDPWIATCETHGTMISSRTLGGATKSMSAPEEWCEDCAGIAPNNPNGKMRLKVTSAQMLIVQIHCDDPAHDEDREDWWPTQVTASAIEFPAERASDVADLFTEIANSESDDPGGDRGAWRTATSLASKIRQGAHTPNARHSTKSISAPEEWYEDGAFLTPNGARLPPGVIESTPPDEESRYGSDLGTNAKVTWSWLKNKYGKNQLGPYESDWSGRRARRLYIQVRPFDSDGQWLPGLVQEFTYDGLRDAQRYGFDLIRDLPQVQGFWIGGHLDIYWTKRGQSWDIRVMDLGVYERANAHTPNAPGGYYVWVIGSNGNPLDSEGPYGPMDFIPAKQNARIGATEGKHDRAVSIGLNPQAESFDIVRHYEAGTGRRLR